MPVPTIDTHIFGWILSFAAEPAWIGAGVGAALTAAVGAVGASLWQPYLKARFSNELRDAQREAEYCRERLAEFASKVGENLNRITRLESDLDREREEREEKDRQFADVAEYYLDAIGEVQRGTRPRQRRSLYNVHKMPSVLLVEDHFQTRKAMRKLLESAGYPVKMADGVKSAAAVLDAEPPAFVLLDLALGDEDGRAVIQHVRDHQIPTKVIVLTGLPEGETEDLKALGAYAVLKKPINFGQQLTPLLQDLPEGGDVRP